jgi:hypothetical protein
MAREDLSVSAPGVGREIGDFARGIGYERDETIG